MRQLDVPHLLVGGQCAAHDPVLERGLDPFPDELTVDAMDAGG